MHYGDDMRLTDALRRGEADAFATLVDLHNRAMIRVALAYVPTRAAAEEAVQETWIAVLRGIEAFEGRASLKTWIFRILTNVAMRAGARERRRVPFSALAAAENTGEPSVDPDRFLPADHELYPGHWAIPPARWPTPDEGLLAGETRDVIAAAIAELPVAQRTVIGLRDIEGWSEHSQTRPRGGLAKGLSCQPLGRSYRLAPHLLDDLVGHRVLLRGGAR
jgi:RNA polymerase sigma-70 factor, ECF subfamily